MIPDIRKDILVPATPARAFEIFWSDIGLWWPMHTHSLSGMSGQTARGVRFEPHLGGGIIETMADGTEARWGLVTDWQPGKAMEFTWQLRRPEAEATRVRITFAPSEAGTRVTLVHSGWEAQGAAAAENRENYDRGWEAVFMTAYAQATAHAA
jgi:hypothetical protein